MRSTVPGFAEGVVSFDSKTVVCTIASRLTIKSDLVVAGLIKIKSNLIQNRSRTNEVALATFRLSKKDDAQRERSMRCAVSGFCQACCSYVQDHGSRTATHSSLIFFVPTLAFKFLVFPECWIVGRPLWRRY